MRERLYCANWKMNKTLDEALAFAEAFPAALDGVSNCGTIVIFPPAPYLLPLAERLSKRGCAVGAQACYHEPEGAYTGATACEMVHSVGARFVLVGHSERRRVFREEDAELNLQLQAAFAVGLRPILCVGETLLERESGRTQKVVDTQLVLALHGLSSRELNGFAIAYEPVWAIGTGKTATPEQAEEAHRAIRETLAGRYDPEVAAKIPLLYGGSVSPKNAAAILAQPDVDGALVGGASLDPSSFAAIVRAGAECEAKR